MGVMVSAMRMMEVKNMRKIAELVEALTKEDEEKAWIEFKRNNQDPDMIGEDISALANGAALHSRERAYMVWGVDDSTHQIVGTSFDLRRAKKGNEELENWLRGGLSDNADFEFYCDVFGGLAVGVLIIHAALGQPVLFKNTGYIRVGSYTKKLTEYPALESGLWNKLHNLNFEAQYAVWDLTCAEALQELDHTVYFDRLNIPIPSGEDRIAHYLQEEGLIIRQDNGLFAITNLGAITLTKNLHSIPSGQRKAIRVVQYQGKNRLAILKDEIFDKGYAIDFENVMRYIEALIPSKEPIINSLRTTKNVYPVLAIREILANALIHQDFSITGAGPIVEIFSDRIEVTNPGTSLVDVARIIDNPPRSRNEKLASLMRRLRLCEELGSGWDKVAMECERMMLPAPKIDVYENSMKVTIWAEIPFSAIPLEERVWACYLHACLKQVQGEAITNRSLRERFGLGTTASGSISRIIKDAMEKGLIKPRDPDTAPRYMSYVPIWA